MMLKHALQSWFSSQFSTSTCAPENDERHTELQVTLVVEGCKGSKVSGKVEKLHVTSTHANSVGDDASDVFCSLLRLEVNYEYALCLKRLFLAFVAQAVAPKEG